MKLKSFFKYYGSKFRFIDHYPAPKYDKIIEPMAGSAAYACRWSNRQVQLSDVDEKIVGVWDYLIKVPYFEFLSLPSEVYHVDDLGAVPQEVKWFVGFNLALGSSPAKSARSSYINSYYDDEADRGYWNRSRQIRIASQLRYIRHWKVRHASYNELDNEKATWFIDPPYVNGGAGYRYHDICYPLLARWCCTRKGQVIVCEKDGTWLPFRKLGHFASGTGRKKSGESIKPFKMWSLESVWIRENLS